ncbi:MAG: signal peptide peptidase SppA [Candidatus Babeliales bacterium]
MSTDQKTSWSDTFFKTIKNLFYLFLFLAFVPSIIVNLKNVLSDTFFAKAQIGYMTLNGDIADSHHYVKQIEAFAKDNDIKGLLIRINSPGGYAGSSYVLFNELRKFQEKKPVVAVIENICASGAYYAAITADTIISSPLAMVGSIGVLMGIPNVKELMEHWRVHYTYVQSGTYKTTGSPLKDLEPQELTHLQALSDNNYEQFIKDVAENRSLNIKHATEWADGKIFTGNQALKLHLVDKLGTFKDGLDEIKRLAKIKDEIQLVQIKKPSLFMRLISGDEDDADGQEASAASVAARFIGDIYTKLVVQHSSPVITMH